MEMAKWEYQVVKISMINVEKDIERFLNEEDQEGWELVEVR